MANEVILGPHYAPSPICRHWPRSFPDIYLPLLSPLSPCLSYLLPNELPQYVPHDSQKRLVPKAGTADRDITIGSFEVRTENNCAVRILPSTTHRLEGSGVNSLPGIGGSLATKRQAFRSAPILPTLVWDLSVPTISSDMGSDISPNSSASGKI